MPGYNDTRGGRFNEILSQQAGASGLSLGELFRRAKAQREARQAAEASKNPGAAPVDAQGGQQQVSIPGEAPIQAQPVAQGGGPVGVQIGQPRIVSQEPAATQTMRLSPMTIPVQAQRQPQPVNPQASMDPRAAQLRALMAQYQQSGMSQEQAFRAAMQRVQAGGGVNQGG